MDGFIQRVKNSIAVSGLGFEKPSIGAWWTILLLPSALAQGSESRIYSHKVCMYVCGGSHSGMLRRILLHTIGIGHMCSHSLTHSDMLDSDIDHRQRAFL